MTREEVVVKLKEILKFSLPNGEQIVENAEENSNLYTDLGLSSVGMLYSVIAIEEVFKISFGNADFGDFNTVKDVIDFIWEKVENK